MGVKRVEMRCQRGSFVCIAEKDIAKPIRPRPSAPFRRKSRYHDVTKNPQASSTASFVNVPTHSIVVPSSTTPFPALIPSTPTSSSHVRTVDLISVITSLSMRWCVDSTGWGWGEVYGEDEEVGVWPGAGEVEGEGEERREGVEREARRDMERRSKRRLRAEMRRGLRTRDQEAALPKARIKTLNDIDI